MKIQVWTQIEIQIQIVWVIYFKQALNACANKLYTSDAGPLAGQERTLFNQFTWNSDWLELYSMPRPPSIGENKFKSASQDIIIIIMDTILMSWADSVAHHPRAAAAHLILFVII